MGRGEASNRKLVGREEWEKRLTDVKIKKEDMNTIIMNFLVTEGYVEAADTFCKESGTQPGVDLNAITDRMEIRKAVQSGNVDFAVERVNDLSPEILEEKQELYFHLQQQRLIELIRLGKTEEALEFAQDILAPQGEENPEFLEELERTVALLAFEDTKNSPLADLMDIAQRQKTASELNAAILSTQCQEKEPQLLNFLRMVIWAQQQLGEKVDFPRINDLTSAALADNAN
ncbi:hypothetical protein WJX74_006917 [Apatococcus lobatus]|uniref:CTLH domain-containing protein n=1 Tax=Apatococcus lobatus TaxID=904363 RepID=A0AAW1S2R0_9CHLO